MRGRISRAKRKSTNTWIYGFYYQELDESEYLAVDSPEDCVVEWDNVVYRGLADVYPDTIGEEYGLKDSIGMPAFEGDILRVVDSNWGYGGNYDKTHDGYLYHLLFSLEDMIKEEIDILFLLRIGEIVGNIYDNPEFADKLEGRVNIITS